MADKNKTRQSPYSLSAEKAVLGCLLINKDAIHKTIHSLSINAFYDEAHKIIYKAICNMFEDGQIVDSVTITDYLKKNKNLKQVGDSYYISGLIEDAPSSENVDYYSDIVKQKYTLRTIINTAIEMSTEAYNEEHDPIEILDQAEKKIFELSKETERGEFVSINPILEEVLKEWGTKTDSGLFGIPSGFIDLDEKLSGFQKSDLIILAGRPSMGKTALCLSIARNVAVDYNKKVGIFSLEMSKKQLGERLISSESRINSHKIKTSQLPKGDWRKLSTAADSLSKSKIFIDDSPGLNVMELRAKARQLKAEKKIDLLIVDYIQLLNSGTRSENRQQEMSYISRSLKALAKELDIPVICLSQLSRAVENRTNHRPIMSDLRESGAIEQDADVVLFIYRQFVYTESEEDKNIGEIIIAKHRNGPTGTAKVTFIADYARFENYEFSDRISDVPFS
jgi:replicative DNA helicase|tara:strand:- start:2922 stop:4274 length:1353 start_codon:yes stop_codon:yes gene_type:complete